jgi:hypothetical protein
MSQQVTDLKFWYDQSVKPFLTEHMPDRLGDLDKSLERIGAHDRRTAEELAICFLGDAGIGKSTLINAMVAGHELLLPAGGIGPLTAQAMEVRYGDEPSFEAEYHGPGRLWQGVVFGLERGHKLQLKDAAHAVDTSIPADLLPSMEDDDVPVVEGVASEADRSKLDGFRKQAQLLVKGDQNTATDVSYLLDCLREAVGTKRVWGTTTQPEDEARLRALSAALGRGKDGRVYRAAKAGDSGRFSSELADHASGFLAPIIKTLRVHWPSPLLTDGIVLVDLPGVGIAGDVYRDITRDWIYSRAKAVVLVVGRAGLTQGGADLLHKSDFLTRLLFYRDDPSQDPVILAIAMTRVDDVAVSAWENDKSRKKHMHLAEQCERARTLLRSQLAQQLEVVWEVGDGDGNEAKKEVIQQLCDDALIFPVSAPEYRRLLAADEDDAPFIKDIDQSGVPAMQAGLRATVAERREDAERQRDEAVDAFVRQVLAWAELVRQQWATKAHTEAEMKQLSGDLERVIAPLRDEFNVRRGSFRSFIRQTMPARIENLVGKAKDSARVDIGRYLRGLKDAHWATLRASVRREGAFIGSRHINLPEDFARKFVEPVAAVWGESIIQDLRKETRLFAGDCERLVRKVAAWCTAEGARVPPKLLDAQLEAIKADIKQIDLAGREVIKALREQVKNQLAAVIKKPIAAKCRGFVAKGDDIGPGVKRRILELFDDLAEATTVAAAVASSELLLQCFKGVEQELKTVLKDLDDPLKNAADAILASHRGRLERTDGTNRDRVLSSVTALMEACPPELAALVGEEATL